MLVKTQLSKNHSILRTNFYFFTPKKQLTPLLLFVCIILSSFSIQAQNIAPNATITTNVTRWYSGNTEVNLAKIVDGNVSTSGANDYQVHPSSANGKHITFTFSEAYEQGSFVFYNRIGCCSNRITGSTVTFKKDGVIQETTTISSSSGTITITPTSSVVFNEVVLTFGASSSQNFREIEIFGTVYDEGDGNGGGENPDLSTVAGVGLNWDATTQKLNVDNSTINLWNENRNNNVFIGLGVGTQNTGNLNVFIGDNAGNKNTTGNSNIFLGRASGAENTTGVTNNFIGVESGRKNTTGNYNTFLGHNSGYNNTTASSNSFFGYRSGFANTTGAQNTMLGSNSGYSNTTASNNTFVGYHSGKSTTTGAANTFTGTLSGRNNTTGSYNTIIGERAGSNNTSGSVNTFIGSISGAANTSGRQNVFMGYSSGFKNTTANNNTFIGHSSGYNTTTGANNTLLGYKAGYNNVTGAGNIFLGYQAGYSETGSNKLYIDNSNTETPLIYGDFSADVLTFNGKVGIGTSGTPSKELDVVGDINFTGDLYKNGTLVDLDASPRGYVFNEDSSEEHNISIGYGAGGSGVWNLNIGNLLYIDNENTQARLGVGSTKIIVDEDAGRTDVQATEHIDLSVSEPEGKITLNAPAVGIGTTSPNSILSIYGTNANGWNSGIELNREDGGKGWIVVDGGGMKFRTPIDGDGFYFRDNDNNTSLVIKDGGNVGIGTTTIPSDYKLAVAGKVITEEVKVQLQSSWPDYVFEKDYHLPSLEEVASHIQEKGHLQNIPSAEVVKKEGIFLGDMNAKLLQKIEELTLYTIQQEKKLKAQEKEIQTLKNLSARLAKLEALLQEKK